MAIPRIFLPVILVCVASSAASAQDQKVFGACSYYGRKDSIKDGTTFILAVSRAFEMKVKHNDPTQTAREATYEFNSYVGARVAGYDGKGSCLSFNSRRDASEWVNSKIAEGNKSKNTQVISTDFEASED
jgi:hypothetical protein